MASPRSHPQHSRNMSNNRFAGMIPPLMLVNPSDLQMNGVRVDGSLLSSKTFIDSMTASFSSQHDNVSPSTPEFIDSPSSTVSADSFMPPTPQHMHQGRFMCPEPNCSYSIIGFHSGAELDQHVATGSHIGHPVDFELDLHNEDQAAFHDNSMLPAPMWDHKNSEYFALPMQPKGKQSQGHCSCRYCNPNEGGRECEAVAHQSLELPPPVGGNGFDHRTWQQNMKLEKAMQAVLQQHQRVREAEVIQQNIAFANTAQPFGSFYGAPQMGAYPVYGNVYAY